MNKQPPADIAERLELVRMAEPKDRPFLFERESLRALAWLKFYERAGYEEMRAELLGRRVTGLKELDIAVDRLIKSTLAKAKAEEDSGPDAKTILRDIIEACELWKDRRGVPYATAQVTVADGRTHTEHLNVKGEAFADWLGQQYWRATGEALNDTPRKEAVNLARSRALYDGAVHDTAIRVASVDGKIYIDTADDAWTVIEVDAEGWRMVDDAPVRFRRAGDELPLPVPVRADRQETLAKLGKLINVKKPEDLTLLLGWMVAALRPGRPCCILLIICEPGSAKTTTLRIICSVTDPRVAQESEIPPSSWDIAVVAYNQWNVAWDNVGPISPDVADACCRIVTGGGHRKRGLYSDERVHAIDLRRPMLMTGRRIPSIRSDFVDRSVVIDLDVITEEARRTEGEVEIQLQELRPALFGLLLDGVSAGLRNEEVTRQRLPRLPRMADFLLWCEAAGEAFGWRPGEFLEAYQDAYNVRLAEAAEDDSLLAAIASFMAERCGEDPGGRGAFEGKAGELLEALKTHVEKRMRTNQWGDRVGRSPAEARWFPTTPRGLSEQLRDNRKPLEALGVLWSKDPDPHSRTAGGVHRLVMTERAAGLAFREQQEAKERARQAEEAHRVEMERIRREVEEAERL